ncbi:3-isopropylmalate dehydratase small subunit [Litorimonas taeanensis]|uniref:3-isopropylmalate dehydratase small subunit n=1 Tax=Litorimonas taeanensis TaxID=568099 RepID=A0A420WLQ4_9PROT|nr:3-isopropylmalate dehydratase small subunit [Litorimonas taeanensis]RKQ71958.1 3-isopropylmalate dehydratase small subunit [Litorimonas taeanensis]
MNAPFIIHTGVAAPFIRDNVDTDQIIPSREMKSVYKTGLKDGLFAGQRYIKDRIPNPDFILNQQGYEAASILLSGQNFGCGSSREHAVWALKEYGFRAVVAESFGEIFYNNCVRNGILPIQLSAEHIYKLPKTLTIDLQGQTVNGVSFDIPEGDKAMLVGGLDPIAMTLQKQAEIDAFIAQDKVNRPWAY